MFDFRKLLKVLEREFSYQEKLLEVLVRERAAIVKLNQDELDSLREAKERLLGEMTDLETQRTKIFDGLSLELPEGEQPKLSHVLEICPPSEGRGQIQHVGENLKRLATNVRDMNNENAALIRQSLGLIASTIAIMSQSPSTDLPTYTRRGAMTGSTEDALFLAPRKQIAREV